MSKTALLALGSGGLSGVAVVAALSGSPLGVVLVYLAPLPLLVVGLGFGSSAFGFAAAAGLAVALALGGFAVAGLYGGMHVIPSWLIVQQALRPNAGSPGGYRTIGHILAVLALLIAFVVMTTAFANPGEDSIETLVRDMLTTVAQIAAPALSEAERTRLVEQLAPLFLGFSAVAWLGMLVVNAGLAQGLLTWRGKARRPTPQWSQIRLPGWFDYVLVATAVIAIAADGNIGYSAHNMVIILLAPYFLVGLAVVHAWARHTTTPGLVLTAFYVLLLLFFLFAAAVVAALGIAEQWVGVRHRLAGRPPAKSE
jgi:hypothetical protein